MRVRIVDFLIPPTHTPGRKVNHSFTFFRAVSTTEDTCVLSVLCSFCGNLGDAARAVYIQLRGKYFILMLDILQTDSHISKTYN